MFRLFVIAYVFLIALGSNLVLNGYSVSEARDFQPGQFRQGGSDPFEPNDSFAQAYGPLDSGAIYEAYVWTQADYDYYYVDVTADGIFEAILLETVRRRNVRLVSLSEQHPTNSMREHLW